MRAVFSFLKRYWAVLVLSVLFAVGMVGILAGYRLGPSLTIVKNGTLALAQVPAGTQVFTDLSRQHTVSTTGELRVGLTPGAHTIIVDAESFQPWNELFMITSSEVTTLSPILVPVNVRAKKLEGAEKTEATRLIQSAPLPSKTSPLVVASGCAVVYASANKIIAEATSTPATSCTPPAFLCETGSCAPTFVYVPAETLHSITLFPGREDALVVAAGGLIYVIELDPREPQFFAPLFKGRRASATSWSENSVVGTDGSDTFVIPLSE